VIQATELPLYIVDKYDKLHYLCKSNQEEGHIIIFSDWMQHTYRSETSPFNSERAF